jgi:hypothetical protein
MKRFIGAQSPTTQRPCQETLSGNCGSAACLADCLARSRRRKGSCALMPALDASEKMSVRTISKTSRASSCAVASRVETSATQSCRAPFFAHSFNGSHLGRRSETSQFQHSASRQAGRDGDINGQVAYVIDSAQGANNDGGQTRISQNICGKPDDRAKDYKIRPG